MKLTKKQVEEIENRVLNIVYNPKENCDYGRLVEQVYSFNDGMNVYPCLDILVFLEWLENPEAEPKDIKVHKIKARYYEHSDQDMIAIERIDLEAFKYQEDIID